MPTDQIMEPELEAVPAIPSQEEKAKRQIILAGAAVVLIVTIVLLLLLFLTSSKPGEQIFLPVVPSPTPIASETNIRPSSPYATDSAILKIEEDLKNLDQELQRTDLKEAGLNPPILDLEVK